MFTDKASSSKQSSKEQEREIKEVFDEEKQYNKVLDNCQWCFDGSVIEKHLILSVAEKVCFNYLTDRIKIDDKFLTIMYCK